MITIALAACGSAAPAAPTEPETLPTAPVTCAPVMVAMVSDPRALRGVIAPPARTDAQVASTIAGRVRALGVEEGDRVKAGQVIATIDEPATAAGADSARAAVTSAEAALANAVAQRDRAERLQAQGIAPQKELEDARARVAAAQAELETARAGRRVATGQLARTEIRAPVAGTVLRVFRRAGEAVDGTPATPIVELADLAVLELRAEVPAARLMELRVGDRASIAFDALPDVLVPGRVVRVALAVDPATSLGAVRIQLAPPADQQLLVGLTGTASIVGVLRAGLIVPAAAIRRSTEGEDEVVVCAAGKADAPMTAAVHPIERGVALGGMIEIASGVTATDRVVIDRALGIEDGQPLEPAP